jgi:ribosomal protein S11
MKTTKLYITFNRFNNLHLLVATITGETVFKKTYGCVDKSSKLKHLGVQKLFVLLAAFLVTNNYQSLVIFFQGNGFQKFSFLRDFFLQHFTIIKVFYCSTKSYNGCRKKKQRRL